MLVECFIIVQLGGYQEVHQCSKSSFPESHEAGKSVQTEKNIPLTTASASSFKKGLEKKHSQALNLIFPGEI